MNNPFEMVFGIVLVVMIASVLRARYNAKHGVIKDKDGNYRIDQNADGGRLEEEVKYLKERVAVLEKIATDDRGARELQNEIEKLRDR
tara:strand:+ start:123 stop:386 length:264 start_codon:yes stop_codon:yes gene_type:complete